jgi:hypothetical protein
LTGRNSKIGVGSRVAIAVLSLSLGGVLLFLSIPRLVAEVVMLPGNRVLAAIQNGTVPSDRGLEILAASRERAFSWSDAGSLRIDFALAQLLTTRKLLGGSPEDHRRVATAIQSLREGLARAPADPYAWTRLAYVSVSEAEPARRVVPLLEMAIRTAPVEPNLTSARLELCFIEWGDFPPSDQPLLAQQLRIAWHQSGDRLVRLAQETGRTEEVLNALPQPDRARFEERIAAGAH